MILLSTTHLADFPGQKLPELPQRLWLVGEQIALGDSIFFDHDRAVVDAVADPMPRHIQFFGQLRDRQIARHVARVGLARADEHAVFEADRLHGAGQDRLAACRAMALRREQGRDLGVALSFASQANDERLDLRCAPATREAAD